MSSRCSCNNPCTCYFEYDGDRPDSNYTLPYQYGRYSTRKKGSGTTADPYIIEFMDSEEFEVEAGQARYSGTKIVGSQISTSKGTQGPIDTLDYETPGQFFLFFVALQAFSSGLIYPSNLKFWFVTAEATFVNNQQITGVRRIHINWVQPAPTYGNVSTFSGDGITVAANTSTGLPAGTEDITLSCSGMAPFPNFTGGQAATENPAGIFSVWLFQSSTQNMNVSGIKFTAVAI